MSVERVSHSAGTPPNTAPPSFVFSAAAGGHVKKSYPRPEPAIRVGSLRIDPTRHEVTLGERSIAVTASEFRLLELLGSSPGAVFTRRRIMEHLWAGRYFGDGHPVDTHVLNLRRKLEADPTCPRRLLTVRGVGFKLVPPDCEA